MLYFRGNIITNIINYFKHNKSSKYEFKIKILFATTILFSFLYLLLEDIDFQGLNVVQEKIKDELIEKTVEKEIDENVPEAFRSNYESEFGPGSGPGSGSGSQMLPNKSSNIQMDKATEEVKKDIKEEELQAENIKPSLLKKFFNRIYFSINTGCLLGYGDIYPISILAKLFAMIQAMITIMLILY
jgi:hypothetical protein